MANNLYNSMNGQNENNNANSIWQEVQRLKQTIQNPRAEVERLLNTGAMSQQKFNELARQANKMFGK